jgi:hypothetical protein
VKQIKPLYPLYLKKTKLRGWGLFCSKPIPKGKVFEICPTIYLPAKFWKRTSDTPIEHYRFSFWGNACCLVLGFGSLINHSSDEENCSYRINRKSKTYSFFATKNIPANQEIFHDYNWDDSVYSSNGMKSKTKETEEKKKPKSTATKKTAAKKPKKK